MSDTAISLLNEAFESISHLLFDKITKADIELKDRIGSFLHAHHDARLSEAMQERERCARIAKGAWLEADIGIIADADAQNALCEWIETAIREGRP